MRRRASILALAVTVLWIAAGSAVQAAKPPELPKVGGGGVVLNMRNFTGGPPGLAFAGFTARAIGPETADGFPARGQVQLIARFDAPDGFPYARVHGEVVCLWNHGSPAAEHAGNSDSDADVWEIRLRITNTNLALPPALDDAYVSIYIQDGGARQTDFAGERFTDAADPDCGEDGDWDLEPLIRGNVHVH